MHGQLARNTCQQYFDSKVSFSWPTHPGLKGETESLICAAQDQALKTRYLEHKIFKIRAEGKCRICKINDETITHITSGCTILAKN